MSLRNSPIFCGRQFMALMLFFFFGGGAPKPPTSCLMLHHLKFELSRPDAFYLMCFNTVCGEKDIQGTYLWCQYSKWYLCMGNGILFLTDEWMFLRNSHFFVTKNVSPQGVSTQNLSIHAECSATRSEFWPILVSGRVKSVQNTVSQRTGLVISCL